GQGRAEAMGATVSDPPDGGVAAPYERGNQRAAWRLRLGWVDPMVGTVRQRADCLVRRHDRLAHRLTGVGAVLGGSEQVSAGRIGSGHCRLLRITRVRDSIADNQDERWAVGRE